MFKKNKRAEVESQFNWVFVLIAGGVILLFFVTFIYRHKVISDKKLELKFNQNLDLRLSMAEITSKSLNNVSDLLGKSIQFSCKSVGQVNFKKKTIFSPSVVEAKRLYIYSYPFEAAFKVNNFVYVINPNVRYVFIKPNPFAFSDDLYAHFYNIMPEGTMLITPLNDKYEYKNIFSKSKSVRFVFINTPVYLIEIDKDIDKYQDVSAIKITSDKKLVFYEKNKNGKLLESGKSFYFDDASLFGAFIVDKKEVYDCMMENAFNRLNYVSEVYIGKIERLESISSPDCRDVYISLKNDIGSLKDIAESLGSRGAFKSFSTTAERLSNFKTLNDRFYTIVDEIAGENKRIELSKCPVKIY